MPIEVTLSSGVKAILKPNSQQGLLFKVRKEFSKRGPLKVKQAIIQDMIKGISPVNGKGKFKRYSASYKDVIRNKAAYRVFNGKVVRITDKKQVAKFNRSFFARSSPTKQISPVNLRHTGDLHRSLRTKTKGGFATSFRLVTEFRSRLADIHNRLGAGKSKVIRRLLPTKQNEKFNNKITATLISELKSAVDKVAKQFSRQ